MKKTAISMIALALMFIFALPAQSVFGQKNSINPKPLASGIVYNVFVNLSQEESFCGNYLIMLTDAAGSLVAPAQPYIEGVAVYSFFEPGYWFVGTRTAKMIASPTLGPVCDQLLTADPASMFNLYMPGTNYPFNLYPKLEAQHE